MKKTILLMIMMILLLVGNKTYSQKMSDLLGKWNVEYIDSEERAVYEFKYEGDQLIGYCISYTDETGMEESCMEKVITDIELKGNTGKSRYHADYEGKKYNLKCSFKIVNKSCISANYSYLFYKGKEIWRKVNT